MTDAFPEGSLVWANFQGISYAAIVTAGGAAGLGPPQAPDELPLVYLGGGGCGYLSADLCEPFDPSDAEKMSQPLALDSIEEAMGYYEQATQPSANDRGHVRGPDSDTGEDAPTAKEDRRKKREERKEKRREERKRKREARSDVDRDIAEHGDVEVSIAQEDHGIFEQNAESHLEDYAQGSPAARTYHRRGEKDSRTKAAATRDDITEAAAWDVPPEHHHIVTECRRLFQELRDESVSSMKLVARTERDFIRLLTAKVRTNTLQLQRLRNDVKRFKGSDDPEDQRLVDALQRYANGIAEFNYIEYARANLMFSVPVPQKPEFRRGGQWHFVDEESIPVQLRLQGDSPKAFVMTKEFHQQVSSQQRRRLSVITASSEDGLGKMGLRESKSIVMRKWLKARELTTLKTSEDVQAVSAWGALPRRFTEAQSKIHEKIALRASKSKLFRDYLRENRIAVGPTAQIPSAGKPQHRLPAYLNFQGFAVTKGALDDHELLADLYDGDGHGRSLILDLPFDPAATFGAVLEQGRAPGGADEMFASFDEALQRVQQSAESSVNSAMLPSRSHLPSAEYSESVGMVLSAAGTDVSIGSRAHRKGPSTSTAGDGAALAPALGAAPAKTWRDGAKSVIIDHLSHYVHGTAGRPRSLPRQHFSELAAEMLNRALKQKGAESNVCMVLNRRANGLSWHEEDGPKLRASIDHYMRRKYSAATTHSKPQSRRSTSHPVDIRDAQPLYAE